MVWYRNLEAYRIGHVARIPRDRPAMLVGQNFLDDEFLTFDGPKVFSTWEAMPHMTPRTVEIIESGAVDDYYFSFGDPDADERMCYPALHVDRHAVAADLAARSDERRPRPVCMMNRVVDRRAGTLHGARLDVVAALDAEIDLFGRPGRDDGRTWDHPRYMGAPVDKRRTLLSYTFNVCFENSDHPGYVTEKLIDAIVAGCVPLYRGGGGLVGDVVPPRCFVDCAVLDPAEVATIVRTMPHDEVRAFRQAGIDFLRSDAAIRFTAADYRNRIAARLSSQSR